MKKASQKLSAVVNLALDTALLTLSEIKGWFDFYDVKIFKCVRKKNYL